MLQSQLKGIVKLKQIKETIRNRFDVLIVKDKEKDSKKIDPEKIIKITDIWVAPLNPIYQIDKLNDFADRLIRNIQPERKIPFRIHKNRFYFGNYIFEDKVIDCNEILRKVRLLELEDILENIIYNDKGADIIIPIKQDYIYRTNLKIFPDKFIANRRINNSLNKDYMFLSLLNKIQKRKSLEYNF